MFINKKLLLFLLILTFILIIIIPNFYVRILLIGFLAYGYFLYAKQKGYNGILGISLFVVLNVIGLIILFILPDKNLKLDNDPMSDKKKVFIVYRTNRAYFYLGLLIFTVLFSFLSLVFIKSLGSDCTGMECLAIAPLIIGAFVILSIVLIITNLKLIISYEAINKNTMDYWYLFFYIFILIAIISFYALRSIPTHKPDKSIIDRAQSIEKIDPEKLQYFIDKAKNN